MDETPLPSPTDDTPVSLVENYLQVHLKTEEDKLLMILPKPQDNSQEWLETLEGIKQCLKHQQKTWPTNTPVHLKVEDRLLDVRQLQAIAEILQDNQLQLQSIITRRRQTAVAAATSGYSVEQQNFNSFFGHQSPEKNTFIAEPLYLKTTIRSGVDIRHPGTVIIQGDVNPGGAVIADGDILIWGNLRGIAHAGARGHQECTIMALRMDATQLRIAELVARSPATFPEQFEPEIAYITPEGIRITQAYNFSKAYYFDKELGGWKINLSNLNPDK